MLFAKFLVFLAEAQSKYSLARSERPLKVVCSRTNEGVSYRFSPSSSLEGEMHSSLVDAGENFHYCTRLRVNTLKGNIPIAIPEQRNVVRLARSQSLNRPHFLGGGVLRLLVSGTRSFTFGIFTPERLLQLIQKPVVELVETCLGSVFWRRRGRALDGALEAALGGPGAVPGVLSGHVGGHTAVGGRDHVVGPRRGGQAGPFALAFRHFAGTAGRRVRALGGPAGTIGLVYVPIVLHNGHHEGHGCNNYTHSCTCLLTE
ncbi:hypothetical protein TcasGA2_TC007890 [Tribolium castaneum]|uniref:Uncharacterized protein n=1 Tax=Tribolium castaneum TaxID=7070 RepID=D2A2W2_TRICA|nr:hypothetical protein TcasGA2_TC007890 [Tribolium castaneum]